MNHEQEERFLNLLGLAQRAGKLASGESAVEQLVRSGKAALLVVAENASEGSKKKYKDMADFYKVTMVSKFSRETLGLRIGKADRAAVAIADEGFAKSALKLLDAHGGNNMGVD